MSVLPVGIAASGDQAYTIEDSLRFRSSATAYLDWTPASAGNTKKWTWSGWVKRARSGVSESIIHGGTDGTANYTRIIFLSTDIIDFFQEDSGVKTFSVRTTALYRDPSSWYHIIVAYDSDNATASERAKIYVNGSQVTDLSTADYPPSGTQSWINKANDHRIGNRLTSNLLFDGYMTEINFIDGQALTADDFGEFDGATGVWKPKAYSGTYGTNGFYLPMTATTQAELQNTVLYTGNGSAQSISGVGFSPDLVWIKNRIGANYHYLYDSVRGPNKGLSSNTTGAEDTATSQLTSFDSDGFSLPSDTAGYNNYSGRSYVAWCWDAGSGSPVTNTAGSINSTVKANPEKGFSIVNWVGNGASSAYVGTGLSSTAPLGMAIVKRIDSTSEWQVGHIGNQGSNFAYHLELNSTAANSGSSPYFMGSQSSTDGSLLYLSSGSLASGADIIAYCWAEVAGYSKFGSYTGTGSSGNSVTGLGFKPAWIMYKRADSTGNWTVHDITRDPSNEGLKRLYPHLSNAEQTVTGDITFDSDGFTLDGTGGDSNALNGTYIYMAFADTRDAQFNFDASGNKNNWTPNNINSNASSESSYDIMTDVPTLTDENTANYCTWNPLLQSANTFSEGNLKVAFSASTPAKVISTIKMPSGKWYAEFTMPGANNNPIGLSATDSTDNYLWLNSIGYWTGTSSSSLYVNGSVISGLGALNVGWASGDILGFAVDKDNDILSIIKNGTILGSYDFSSYNFGPMFYACGNYISGLTNTVNFGQRPFKYTPPTGYKKLNTYNLPDSTIVDGSEHFNTVTFSGNGSAASVTGVGFQPNFIWAKNRTNAYSHELWDVIRGVNSTLFSNLTNAEDTTANRLVSFDSDGFSYGTSSNIYVNGTNSVAWNWKANGSGVSNTDGTASNVTVSANTTAGFSVVTYTGSPGDTVGHGLGVAPKMIIQKDRDNSVLWRVFHYLMSGSEDYNPTDNLHLNTNNGYPPGIGAATRINGVNATTFTNTGGYTASNQLAYCFASVEGFSAFGSYTGNGSTDGPFVYTGFRPAFVIYKNTTASGTSWMMYDSSRNLYNSVDAELYAESTSAETSYYDLDFLSNGFKIKTTTTNLNGSGATYIYAAFAENPFKNSLAR